MTTKIRQEIVKSLQLNVDKQKTKTFVNTTKDKSVMLITFVTFNKKRYMTFLDFKEETMYLSKHIVDVKLKVMKTYNIVFIYFNCKISEVDKVYYENR